jgi:uncharacterized membrane protein HdeD (DUF308 family)
MSQPLGWSAPAKSVGDAFVSRVWLDSSCYTLACLLLLLALVGVFLVATELTSKKRRHEWKLRPIACALLSLMCALEAVFFISFPAHFGNLRGLYYALSTFPPVLYSSALYLCAYLFGCVFHDVYFQGVLTETEIALRKRRRAKIQLVVSGVIGAVQLVLWGVSFSMESSRYEPYQGNDSV